MKDKKFVAAILIPSFLLIFIFCVFPVFYGLGISLFDYNPIRAENPFIGLENYAKLLQDKNFKESFIHTIIFVIAAVGGNIILTLGIAQLITSLRSKKLKTVFRTICFIPCIAPLVGTSVVWKNGFLHTDGGVLNVFLANFGIRPMNWLADTTLLMTVLIIFTLWADMGYNIVLFCAGLEGIPRSLEEAAEIDGASPFQRFIKIRIPLIGRTSTFVLMMTIVSYFQMFAQFKIFSSNSGGADYAGVLTTLIYRQSFQKYNMGYGSAIATVLFLMIFVVAMLQNRLTKIDWSYE